MECTYCVKYPTHSERESALVRGTKNFKLDPIKNHETTSQHLSCQKQWLKETDPKFDKKVELLSDTKLGQCVLKQKLKPEQLKRYKVLFNTAYSVGKKGKPFSDYEFILEVQKKNEVDIGEQYFNIEGCKLFLKWISQQLRSQSVSSLLAAPFVSILSDGSTDRSVIEQEIVYLRYVDQCMPTTKMINLMSLESATAEGIFNAIFNALKIVGLNEEKIRHDTPGPKLICGNFDGASVNFGNKSGVFKRLKDEVPQAIGIHCIAHKLELAILDANKTIPYMSTFETTLKGVFKFYYYSPKRRRELAEISEILDQILLHFGDIKQVRWLSSKERAVKAMLSNYEVVVSHLEHDFVAGSRADDANRARGYHTVITSVKFLKFLHFLMDYLPIVAKLSRNFQLDDYLVIELNDHIEAAVIHLTQLKNGTGKYCTQFAEKFDVTNKTFGEIKISTRNVQSVDMKSDKDLHALIDGTIKYIESRFKSLNEKPLSLLQIFNFHQWPLGRGFELAEFGNDQIVELVNQPEFTQIFSDNEKEQIKSEWTELKLYLSRFRANQLLNMYSMVLQNKAATRKNEGAVLGACPTLVEDESQTLSAIEKIIYWLFTISPSTSGCERGFSLMNTLKSKLRTRLTQESLQNQLYIMSEGPSIKEFEPLPSIMYWFENSTRTPHCSGHKLKGKKNETEEDFELTMSGK
ncbi:zinc finger protein 862-like [Mytilus galloprovincialis]|uniref:zinc finger protein 862-like n=1 Tax=Mytilus galloprovincialis TaxID=29158 RepID=UPI003F7C7835